MTTTTAPVWVYDDGGRAAAGYKGTTRDCAVRAIAIATETDYQTVYDLVGRHCNDEKPSKRRRGMSHPRLGVHTVTMQKIMADLGWRWTPTMRIGSGCTVHLTADELPAGRIIASCSRHFVAVIDGVVHDTHDPTRDGTRCVYGYWEKT
jgi:hypothetical protein